MRLKYHYTVEGGIHPSHHQAGSKEIYHNYDTGRITLGLNTQYDSVSEAEQYLFDNYDYVRLDFIQSIGTCNMNMMLKNEPLNYRGRKY